MTPKTKAILTTLAVAIPAFLLGAGTPLGEGLWAAAWPYHSGEVSPNSWQLPLFMVIAAVESLAFGLGVAFVAYGAPIVRRIAPGNHPGLFVAAIAWSLGNWWLHDNLHIRNGLDLTGLLIIDYAFHTTLIVSAAIVAWALLGAARRAPVRGRAA